MSNEFNARFSLPVVHFSSPTTRSFIDAGTRLMAGIIVMAGLLAASACGGDNGEAGDRDGRLPDIPFRQDGTLSFLRGGEAIVTIDIEIAATDSARQRGLMQRSSLPEKSGMLFVFDREEPQGFWMGNTPLGLDLMFVDADSHIVDIDKYNQPYNPSTITSDAPARFVIEVPAGFADTYGISETDRVEWRLNESAASLAS